MLFQYVDSAKRQIILSRTFRKYLRFSIKLLTLILERDQRLYRIMKTCKEKFYQIIQRLTTMG